MEERMKKEGGRTEELKFISFRQQRFVKFSPRITSIIVDGRSPMTHAS